MEAKELADTMQLINGRIEVSLLTACRPLTAQGCTIAAVGDVCKCGVWLSVT